MRVLTVDDDGGALEALSFALSKAGHEPVIARNGREALETLSQGACRLLMLDGGFGPGGTVS